MKNKKIDKYAFGGTAMNIDSPSESLAKAQRNSQLSKYEAMLDPTVLGLNMLGGTLASTGASMAMSNIGDTDSSGKIGKFLKNNSGFISSLLGGAIGMGTMATGGVTGKQINAEGGEIVEMPGTKPVELSGPTHAEGGINMDVPFGTEIYSDRLKGEDGKTMAQRKKEREKQLAKIQKLLEKNPHDKNLQKALEKTKSNNDLLDSQDLSQMQFVRNMVGDVEQYALGSVVLPGLKIDPITGLPINQKENAALQGTTDFSIPVDLTQLIKNNIQADLTAAKQPQVTIPVYEEDPDNGIVNIETGQGVDNNYYFNKATGSKGKFGKYTEESETGVVGETQGSMLENILGNITAGDAIGMFSNLMGPIAQMKNTLANRNATPPEENFYKNFGQKALQTIRNQAGYIDGVRQEQLGDAELSRQGSIARNNNSARSINTQRALNLSTDAQHNDLKSNIYNQFAAQMMQIMGQEANQLNTMDQAVMRGEESRADRELRNTDSFFSDMAKNISDKYRGIGETGKALNQMKERQVTQQIYDQIFKDYRYNPATGKLESKETGKPVDITPTQQANMKKDVPIVKAENISTVNTKTTTTTDKYSGTKHLTTTLSDTDKQIVNKVLEKLNVTVDLDNPDSIRALQKTLGMSATDIKHGKFGKKTLEALKKYTGGK